jgi:hypothetical protein
MLGRLIGRLRNDRRIQANPIAEAREAAERRFHAALAKDAAREACHALQGGLGHRDARPKLVEQFRFPQSPVLMPQ